MAANLFTAVIRVVGIIVGKAVCFDVSQYGIFNNHWGRWFPCQRALALHDMHIRNHTGELSKYLNQHPAADPLLTCLFLNNPSLFLVVSIPFSSPFPGCCLSWTRQKGLSMSSGWGIKPNWSSVSNCGTLSTTTERWAGACWLRSNRPCSKTSRDSFLNSKTDWGISAAGEGSVGSGVWETWDLLWGGDQPSPRWPYLLWAHLLWGESLCKYYPTARN